MLRDAPHLTHLYSGYAAARLSAAPCARRLVVRVAASKQFPKDRTTIKGGSVAPVDAGACYPDGQGQERERQRGKRTAPGDALRSKLHVDQQCVGPKPLF